jgi:hypothetical protein
MQFVLAAETNQGKGLHPDRVESTVTDLTKMINGVSAVVVVTTHITAGVVEASELAFQAQDNAGNLWNLGAFPAEFEDDGKFKGAPNAWISGLANAEPGNLMLDDPQLGTPEYLQGWSPDIDFLGCAKVYKMQQKTCVPAGCYDNVLITEGRSPLEPGSGRQRTYYAPGVGIVRVAAVSDPQDAALVLTEVSQLSAEDLAKVRQEALELEKTAYEASAVYSQTSPFEPPPELPSPEPPQPPTTKPSIEIANAPIGGNGGVGPRACADVNWLGKEPIPDGTTIRIGSIHLDPKGIFELDQGSCSDVGAPSCAGLEWKGDSPPGCSVGAKQVAAADPSQTVLVVLSVMATCESQADCDRLAADAKASGGSQINFEPDGSFGTPSESPSESPSEEQSEPPSEEQSEPPSEEQSEPPSEEQSEPPAESPSNG